MLRALSILRKKRFYIILRYFYFQEFEQDLYFRPILSRIGTFTGSLPTTSNPFLRYEVVRAMLTLYEAISDAISRLFRPIFLIQEEHRKTHYKIYCSMDFYHSEQLKAHRHGKIVGSIPDNPETG